MDPLKKKRKSQKAQLTRFNNYATGLAATDAINICELEDKLNNAEIVYKEFVNVQNQIDDLAPVEDFENQQQQRAEVEDKYFQATGILKKIIREANSDNKSDSSIASSAGHQSHHHNQYQAKPTIKLPKLDLPTFNGNYVDWTSFHDLFSSIIHNNKQLSGAQKLQYLKASLKGEASKLIQSVQVTDANYEETWNRIIKRYENKRLIVNKQFDVLFSQQSIKHESASELRQLIDTTTESVRALKVLDQPIEHWDNILTYVLTKKLDQETHRPWETNLEEEFPKFDDFINFLNKRHRALEAISKSVADKTKSQQQFNKSNTREFGKGGSSGTKSIHHVSPGNQQQNMRKCVVCDSGGHRTYSCPQFTNQSVQERREVAQKKKLCYNCLRIGHLTANCDSEYSCKKCGKRHNTLLHFEARKETGAPPAENNDTKIESVNTHFVSKQRSQVQVLLATAIVKIEDSSGMERPCRALLDPGAQASFISEKLVQQLNLKRIKNNVNLKGVGDTTIGIARGQVHCKLSSRTQDFSINIDALIMTQVTGFHPHSSINIENWKKIKELTMADPEFSTPGPIDVLIGGEVFWDLLLDGNIKSSIGYPTLTNTVFGWVVGGKIASAREIPIQAHHVSIDLDNQLRKFWELEEVSTKQILSKEEIACETHFMATHRRDSTGRYEVELPFKGNMIDFGDSRAAAVSRLKQVERKLSRDPKRQQQYNDFMKEYLDLGHMQPIPSAQITKNVSELYYLPHHAVIRDSSSTTKLRVVFDGSAKSGSGVSLNEKLMVGPQLLPELIVILLRFRLHQVALVADITKFFRQFSLNPKHWDFQRIVWRNSPLEPIHDFHLKTVTYGTASGPYLASRSLQQLAIDEQVNYPIASPVVLRDFYVDDLITGANDTASALKLQAELKRLIEAGGMQLRKWSSNDPAVLAAVPPEERGMQVPLTFEEEESTKTLGLTWQPVQDFFSFTVSLQQSAHQVTKRTILSEVARLFDPLGWLAPIIITAKILMQDLWRNNYSWDEKLPDDLAEYWNDYKNHLSNIQELRIPRIITTGQDSKYQLFGFCDASEKAYAAVIYLASSSSREKSVNLLISKTRVAPTKTISLPRLELCGAVLLAKLMKKVELNLQIPFDNIFAWTDSTIVLSWLAKSPQQWSTFVSHRVSDIQNIIEFKNWSHVISSENPADLASRGETPSGLQSSSLWWNGPAWLREEYCTTPCIIEEDPRALEELKKQKPAVLQITTEINLTTKFSTLKKLQRVSAYIFRFIKNIRLTKSTRVRGPLTSSELKNATTHWIKISQSQAFSREIHELKQNNSLNKKSKILSLSPFLDQDGVLRVGGRLKHANIHPDQRNPVLIPKDSKLAELIVSHYHQELLHAGPRLLLAALCKKYWIPSAKSLVRKIIHKCITCFRLSKTSTQQVMGDLPSYRLEPSRPFLHTGLDYGGPFKIKCSKGRGIKTTKAYICLFVCMVTKAVHLELASDLTTETFIGALKRFISRRGICSDLHSDNGTNFIGANSELKELLKLVHQNEQSEEFTSFVTRKGITWHFIPPSAPHFGGIWEAGIKSTKKHLNRVLGSTTLTYEEFSTILTQVEACLNSRPLTQLSSDPNDLQVLTPGHFLIGDSLTAIPEPSYLDLNTNRLSRWQQSQQLLQHFWKRWSGEYLQQLQQKQKWNMSTPNFKVADLVLIKEDSSPPQTWRMGRVETVHHGADGHVRVVTLKTQHGQLKRPIVKLCLLPVEPS